MSDLDMLYSQLCINPGDDLLRQGYADALEEAGDWEAAVRQRRIADARLELYYPLGDDDRAEIGDLYAAFHEIPAGGVVIDERWDDDLVVPYYRVYCGGNRANYCGTEEYVTCRSRGDLPPWVLERLANGHSE